MSWCDLTAYDKQTRFISIKDQTNDTIQKVVNNYQEIAEIVKKYPEVKLTFLAIPPYSIHSWNLYQKHGGCRLCTVENCIDFWLFF
jgi:hypothetical protein